MKPPKNRREYYKREIARLEAKALTIADKESKEYKGCIGEIGRFSSALKIRKSDREKMVDIYNMPSSLSGIGNGTVIHSRRLMV